MLSPHWFLLQMAYQTVALTRFESIFGDSFLVHNLADLLKPVKLLLARMRCEENRCLVLIVQLANIASFDKQQDYLVYS